VPAIATVINITEVMKADTPKENKEDKNANSNYNNNNNKDGDGTNNDDSSATMITDIPPQIAPPVSFDYGCHTTVGTNFPANFHC